MAEACDICVGKDIWADKHKSSANYVQENKNFGLLAAACAGHKKCAEILIKEGADVNCSDESFMYTYREKIRQRAGYAGKEPVDKESGVNKGTPLLYAATYGHIEVTKLLLTEGADVNLFRGNMTVLGMAAKVGQSESLELLIEAGADVNRSMTKKNVMPPLICAVQSFISESLINNKRCIEILIKAGADVNAPFVTCPGACISEILAMLLGAGADVKLFPLHQVVGSYRQLERVKLLIQKGADVNKQNNSGETPMYRAASIGDSTCMELFVKSGADVNTPDNHGVTPLMKVAETLGRCRIEGPKMIGLQLEKNSIHRCNLRYTELIRILLKLGARINCRDNLGRNALELACLHPDTENCKKYSYMFLYAIGEILDCDKLKDEKIAEYFQKLKENLEDNLDLKHLCREAIRKHLIDVDPHEHLFGRIPELGLPSLVTEYLLYDYSLDENKFHWWI